MIFWCEKLAQKTLERHLSPTDRGGSSLYHSSFLLQPSAEKLPKHSCMYSVQPVFQQIRQFYSFLLPSFCQSRADSYCSSSWGADGEGLHFLQSCKLLLQTLGQLSQVMAADCPVLSVLCSHLSLLWANRDGCFTHTDTDPPLPTLCLQPSYLLLCALLGLCRKCLVLLPQFPQI